MGVLQHRLLSGQVLSVGAQRVHPYGHNAICAYALPSCRHGRGLLPLMVVTSDSCVCVGSFAIPLSLSRGAIGMGATEVEGTEGRIG